MDVTHYLPYLLPPLLGAFIGYVTNVIAIRMLFRPLRAWRIFGIRVPLTPGIIPSKRGQLAVKMGEMVGDHLFTTDDVSRALGKESIQSELRQAVTGKLGLLLDRPAGPLASLVPEHFAERFAEIVTLIQNKIVKLICDYLDSDAFERKLRDFMHDQGHQWLENDLDGFLGPERNRAWQIHLDACYSRFFHSPATARLVGGFVDRKTGQLLASRRPLREHLPAELVEVVHAQVEAEIPPLIEKFGEMFQDPQFRRQLVKKGEKAIDAFLDSLGGMAGLLTGFVDLKKLYAKIPEFLDKAGDEIAVSLRQKETQQKLAGIARERFDILLERSLSSYVQNISADKVNAARQFVRDQAIAKIQSRSTIDSALILTESAVDRIRQRPFAELLGMVLPDHGIDRGLDRLVDQLLEALRSQPLRRMLDTVLKEQSDIWIYQKPLGLLATRLPGELRQEIEKSACRLIEEMLKKEAPRLLDTLNVRRMVEAKVNGLNLLQVEDLLMGIMKEQFKYINLFGALLGFLIGCLNLVVLKLS